MRARVALVVALAAALAGCGVTSPARTDYNAAVDALAKGDFEAAEKGLLAARDAAGGDDELRRAAAFDLGLAHARHAESLPESEGERALDLYRQGAAWLRDAVRLGPEDGASRAALEVVLRRIQALADRLNQGENALEARLDRLIEEQRGALGAIRGLLAAVAGAGGEPAGLRADFDRLATQLRQLGAEAGAIADLAADEQAAIRATPDDQRSPESAARLVQLDALLGYLERGRQALADTRLGLRRLQGAAAHERGDAALALLKRAREQLLDPVAVLQRVVADHMAAAQQSAALAALAKGTLKLAGGEVAVAPPWLNGATIAAAERDADERIGEVRDRLAAASTPPAAAAGGAPAPEDPAATRQRAAAAEAVPELDRARAALTRAIEAVSKEQHAAAGGPQGEALAALLAAIERFAELRQLIELASGQQAEIVALLSPDANAAEVPVAERGARLTDGVAKNAARLERLAGMLADARQQALAQAQQQAQAAEQAIAGATQLYDAAERERAAAHAAIRKLAGQIAAARRGGAAGKQARATAEEAARHLEELRRLFFTLVERLKELRAHQGETHDGTAAATAADDDARGKTVPPLATLQAGHAALAEALGRALAAQGEAAGQSQDPMAAKQAEALTAAAAEVEQARAAMASAGASLAEAVQALGNQSVDLAPTVTAQAEAIEHLDAAIALLEPPKQDQQDPPQDKSDDGQQGEQPQEQEQKQVSNQQAERDLQQIRDREAERRRGKPQDRPEPVDKDW